MHVVTRVQEQKLMSLRTFLELSVKWNYRSRYPRLPAKSKQGQPLWKSIQYL